MDDQGRKDRGDTGEIIAGTHGIIFGYPLVMTDIAMENCHRNSEFYLLKLSFSIAMFVYQRVIKSSEKGME